jgi:hypothetical protein
LKYYSPYVKSVTSPASTLTTPDEDVSYVLYQ